MQDKPQLSFWQIWNMSFGFLGIQFGFALQNANTSRIFQLLGADMEQIPLLWIAAPVTGLLVQPIIGYLSDRTWTPLGRRRPYFLVGAILASLALCWMPNSSTLWIAAGVLWLMDASINIAMEPFRAFVGDNLPDRQRTTGFAMQSFFIGIGAVIGSALPYILKNLVGIEDAPGELIPTTVKWAFYCGAAGFLLSVLYTVLTTREYSPAEMRSFHQAASAEQAALTESNAATAKRGFLGWGVVLAAIGGLLFAVVRNNGLEKGLYVLAGGLALFGVLLVIAGLLTRIGFGRNWFVQLVGGLFEMPRTMRQLAWVQFFSWFALFAMWIYATPAITATKYQTMLDRDTLTALTEALENDRSSNGERYRKECGALLMDVVSQKPPRESPIALVRYVLEQKLKLAPKAQEKLEAVNRQYSAGSDWVGILFSVYNGAAALFAIAIPWLANRLGRKQTHALGLLVGAVSMGLVFLIKDPQWLILPFVGIGLVWTCILSLPYALLSQSLPAERMGYFMGVFNFFIVLPQIVAAAILGMLVNRLFAGHPEYAWWIGAGSFLIAAGLALRVKSGPEAA